MREVWQELSRLRVSVSQARNVAMLVWKTYYCGRYLLSVSCADHTGQIWLQGFNDVGELLLGITAKDLHEFFVSP